MNVLDYEVLKLLINILQYNYPETLESALVVDSPFIFSACWAIIRHWLGIPTYLKWNTIDIDSLMNSTYLNY